MSGYNTIAVTADGPVTTIAIARDHAMNALTREVFDEINAAIDAAIAGGARALVMTGEGRAFSSGADLKDGIDPRGPEKPDLGAVIDRYYNPLTRRLINLPIPVLSAVNGPAVGAGLSIALAADIVVMAQSAYLQLAFVNIGLVPDAGATWLVARSIGRARAMKMAMLGERMSAAEAQAVGLVAEVVADGEALPAAQSIAARLAAGPALSIERIRAQVNHAIDADLDTVLDRERDNQRDLGYSEDFLEAVTAFSEKRKPQFKGR